MKKAILFGATGFVGSHLLQELLSSSEYELITVVVRKNLDLSHPKVKVLIGDFSSLPSLKDSLQADDVFMTLGTTRKHTPDPKEYYQIDHDYPVLAAKLAKANGAKSIFLVTSVGADANSPFVYVKTKGEIERDIIALDFQHTHIFRPSMILGQRKEHRPMEKLLINVWGVINALLLGRLSVYKGIDGKDIAKAMSKAAKSPSQKVKIYFWKQMRALLS